MSQKGVQLERETVSCSICLDLLREPVTVPCGHSYCMSCIKIHWDTEGEKGLYRCPQCMQLFMPRPVLVKNTMLAVIVEEMKKTGFQDAPADHCYAGPEDVACDVCTGRKLKACKSCLFCVISFCEQHLQPHYDSPAFSKHELVEPSRNLHEYVCNHHYEVMKMFCRTDQRSICGQCLMDDHKGHDTVSAAAERAERQKELEVSRQKIQQRIQDRERDAKLLREEGKAINHSADKASEDSDKIFKEVMLLMERRRTEVKQEVRSQQDMEVRRVKGLEEKLEEEIAELKKNEAKLEKLFLTKDHNQFLHDYPSLSQLCESTDSYSINISPVSFFEDMAAAVKEVGDKLRDILSEKQTKVSQSATEVDALLSQPELKTRAELLQHACNITIDPNTANTFLLLSKGNRKATVMSKQQPYCRHPDRFTGWCQVLSKEGLRGRCYWEVEWEGEGVCVTVAYKSIMRGGRSNECRFGHNEKSWALDCYNNSYNFWFNDIKTHVSGPRSSKIGVYLDHDAGALSFYNISETVTLLHRVHTTFTEPLHAGLRFYYVEVSAGFCELKQTDKL